MELILKALKSRTVWFGILVSVLPILAQYIGVFNLTPMMQMVALQVIAGVVVVLRFLTTEAISDK